MIMLSMLSCNKENQDNIKTDIQISYIDKDGNDMLNPLGLNTVKEADIDLYYLKDGIKTRVYDGNMDNPENFKIGYSETQHIYLITIFINEFYDANKISETYIEFGDRSDTIKASWYANKSRSNIYYLNVWYNNELKISDGVPIGLFQVILE